MSSWESNLRLAKVRRVLRDTYGVRLDLNPNRVTELQELFNQQIQTKDQILLESTFNSYHQDPAYSKAMMIEEALRIFLSEVLPSRKRKLKESVTEWLTDGTPELDQLLKKNGINAIDFMKVTDSTREGIRSGLVGTFIKRINDWLTERCNLKVVAISNGIKHGQFSDDGGGVHRWKFEIQETEK